jgi:LCP family protein required for cell wall assembly
MLLAYLLAPIASRFVLLGIDRTAGGSQAGRSDTIQVFSVDPLLPTVKLLSIPRDLWVTIPEFGENRINTAHFFAEAALPGSGPGHTMRTITQNFSLPLRYYVRLNLNNFPGLIDSMGGITVNLPQAMAGYPAGSYRLNGEQAMAFVRSRSDGDDFFRMSQAQFFIRSFALEMLNPAVWLRMPEIIPAALAAVDTNLPIWLWPRLGLALARASLTGVDSYAIDRSMVTPFVTSEGAQVLLPNWAAINELVKAFK